MPEMTFEYYTGNTGKPPMDDELHNALLGLGVIFHADKIHIVHVGTVGDARHRRVNPDSRHLTDPPRAIDIKKLFIKGEGWEIVMNFAHDLGARTTIGWLWENMLGYTAYHEREFDRGHLHLEV